jgi:hypothetical protein
MGHPTPVKMHAPSRLKNETDGSRSPRCTIIVHQEFLDQVHGGKNVIYQDLRNATGLDYNSVMKPDNEDMLELFLAKTRHSLSEGNPNVQGGLKFVMLEQLLEECSVLENGSGEEEERSAMPMRSLKESEMPPGRSSVRPFER